MIKKILPLLVLAGLLPAQQLVDGVVAIVGETAILQSDVLQSAQIQAMQNRVDLSNNQYLLNRYLEDALNSLVNQHVIYYIAEEDTLINVSSDELDAALEKQIQGMISRAGSAQLLEDALGKPVKNIKKDYRDELHKLMLVERYQQSFYHGLNITRPEVIQFFEEYQDSIPPSYPQSRFSLIEVPVKPGKEAEKQTIQLLNSLLDSLNAGVDFADLAAVYSEDPGSAGQGGDLGYITRGTLVKEYEEVAYALDINEISKPVRTEYGFHLVQLLDKQGEKVHTRHILRMVEPSDDDRDEALALTRELFALIEDNQDVFDSLAVNYSPEFENMTGVYGWKYDAEIPDEILSLLADLTPGSYSYPVESRSNSFLLGFLYDKKESLQPTLENSWDYIEQLALQKKMNDLFQEWITKAKKDIYIQVL